mgnify:CR=1 FL=1
MWRLGMNRLIGSGTQKIKHRTGKRSPFSLRLFLYKFVIFLSIPVLIVTDSAISSAMTYTDRLLQDQIWYEKCAQIAGITATGTNLEGSDNAEKVWNYLKAKGFSDEQVAGIMGNLAWESGDPSFNNATSSEELSGGGGFGLAQWTGGRRNDITAAAKANNRSLTDLNFQLDYLYNEIQTRTERNGGSKTEEQGLKEITDVKGATEYFMYNFERPGDLRLQERINYAEAYLAKYGTGDSSSSAGSGSSSSGGGDNCECTPSSSQTTGITNHGDAQARIQEVIDTAISDSTGRGVDLRIAVSGDVSASGGAGDQIPSASVIKLVVAAALSNNKVPLASVANDLTLMIRDSNNEAANRLIDRAGGFASINATAASLGVDASIGRKMLESPGASDPNRISVAGSDAILTAIKTSESGSGKMSKDYADAIMNAMKAQTVNTKWGSSGIPKQNMAHKTGELYGAQHDVGYFFNGDKWLAVSILTNNPSGSPEPGITIVRDTAKKIYNAWLNDSTSQLSGEGGCGTPSNAECGEGGLIGTLKCYAWPDYKGSGFTEAMPDYTAATERAVSEGRYVGGNSMPGIDCGGFITTLLVDSGHEPGYNYGGVIANGAGYTVNQFEWTTENWTVLGKGSEINIADLRPGDVANDRYNHTFMWIGPVEGFQPTNIASASLDSRAPMAGTENPTDPNMTWFGKR